MRHSNYPTCTSIEVLESQPDGAVLYLPGWALYRYGDYTFSLMDGSGRTIRIYGISEGDMERWGGIALGGTLIGVDMHVRVVRPDEYYTWNTQVEVYLYRPTQSKCTCGAVHTSFPDHHSQWCDSYSWR